MCIITGVWPHRIPCCRFKSLTGQDLLLQILCDFLPDSASYVL